MCIKASEIIPVYGGDDGALGFLHCACSYIPLQTVTAVSCVSRKHLSQ
jgi:hypothetical protein